MLKPLIDYYLQIYELLRMPLFLKNLTLGKVRYLMLIAYY